MLPKNKLNTLYSSGKSLSEIATLLHCSVHKIKYWMEKYQIPRRSISEAVYTKLNPNGNPFSIKTSLNQQERYLFGLAIGIYWGEGTKVTKHSVRVTNSDPALLRVFIRFLKTICQIEEKKLQYSIVAFNDSNINNVKSFWANQLKISADKFGTIVQIAPQGKGTYRKKSQFGVCTVTFGNTKLKQWIMEQIQNTPG